MQFSTVEVIKTKENWFFIEWDMAITNPPESIDDYEFEIWWSYDPVSGFLAILDNNDDPIVIDGAVGPLTYTHEYNQYDFNKDRYYKVFAREKAVPTHTFFSEIVFVGMYNDGVHEVIKHAEGTLHQMYYGEPCFIIKRKSFGARCPDCWSPTRQQRIRTHCDTCHGTGFVIGYYQPIEIQVAFDSDPKKSDSQKEWENVYDTKRGRISNYPLVRPKDLIINRDDYKRYVVTHVETTKLPNLAKSAMVLSKQNYILSQLLTLEELNPDDNEYFIDIDSIPEPPPDEEGGTGGTHPWFNDHKPVTTEDPLTVDSEQFLQLKWDPNDFKLGTNGQLQLLNTIGNIALQTYVAAEVFPDAFRAAAVNDDGEIVIANYTNLDHVDRVVGIALTAAGIGNNVIVQNLGRITNSSWNWDVGKGIFFDENGILTQGVPIYGFWLYVAKPITSTIIDVFVRTPIIRADQLT